MAGSGLHPFGEMLVEMPNAGAICSACDKPNLLAIMRKMTMLDLTELRLIWIPWTQGGTLAHALAADGRTVLGPCITFTSAETFERALYYIGMTDEQLAKHREGMQHVGNGCAMVSAIPDDCLLPLIGLERQTFRVRQKLAVT